MVKRISLLSKRSLRRRFLGNTSNSHTNLANTDPSDVSNRNNSSNDDNVSSVVEPIVSDNKNHNDVDAAKFLVNWKQEHNITSSAVSSLLVFLNSTVFPNLPKDCRTLMQTPTTKNIVNMHPGQYIHVGLKDALDCVLADESDDINEVLIDFNIDGLPISKSSNSGFWLILGRAHSLPNNPIFFIGIYHGSQKPKIFSEFLKPHVAELKDLMNNYTFRNRIVKINITYICDAPARAAVTGTKSHNAYFGCNKCVQEGSFINGRMTFQKCDDNLRTN